MYGYLLDLSKRYIAVPDKKKSINNTVFLGKYIQTVAFGLVSKTLWDQGYMG